MSGHSKWSTIQDISETPRYPNSVTSMQDQLSVHSEIISKEQKKKLMPKKAKFSQKLVVKSPLS